ncbi:MAG: 2Fe-2S iron-sulfur cluster-binding protein [Pseudomonadota bacterium]
MPELLVIDSENKQHTVQYESPQNLMELLQANEFSDIAAVCGGQGVCATCHIYLSEEAISLFPDKEIDEEEMLSLTDEYNETLSRLSCQLELSEAHDGMQIALVNSAW